jgi:hypothetical protein
VNDPVVDVILLDVPVALWARWRDHLDRTLSALGTAEGVPARLAALRARLRDAYPTVAETADAELRSAGVRRATSVDVAYPVPRRGRAELDDFLDALEDLDAYAAEAGREDLVTPADLKSFRRWYFGEIAKQVDGGFPAPWPGD